MLKKQTSFIIYRLPTKENKLLFFVSSFFRIYIYLYIYIYILKKQHMCIYIYTHINIYMYAAISNGKQKPRRFLTLFNAVYVLILKKHV